MYKSFAACHSSAGQLFAHTQATLQFLTENYIWCDLVITTSCSIQVLDMSGCGIVNIQCLFSLKLDYKHLYYIYKKN